MTPPGGAGTAAPARPWTVALDPVRLRARLAAVEPLAAADPGPSSSCGRRDA